MPTAPTPEFVFFDLGNVLAFFDRDRALRQMAAVAGCTPEAAAAAIATGNLQVELECGRSGWPEFHREFSRLTHSTSEPAALAAAASDMFTLNIGMLPVIAGLERSGVRIGLLSNTCAVHWEHLLDKRYAVITGNGSTIVLSHEGGCMKPHPEIYRIAAQAAGVEPGRIFFTDDIPAHVQAAREAGWDAVLFESAAGLANDLDRRGINLGL